MLANNFHSSFCLASQLSTQPKSETKRNTREEKACSRQSSFEKNKRTFCGQHIKVSQAVVRTKPFRRNTLLYVGSCKSCFYFRNNALQFLFFRRKLSRSFHCLSNVRLQITSQEIPPELWVSNAAKCGEHCMTQTYPTPWFYMSLQKSLNMTS